MDGSTLLSLLTDYTVVYSNNTNVGTATVRITGIGNYSGARDDVTFQITAADQTALVAVATPNPVTYGATSVLSTTGGSGDGTVTYEVTTGGEVCSVNITTLTGIKVGSCTITATKAAQGNYAAATATVGVTVTAKSAGGLTIESIAAQAFTGAALTPTVVVKDGGITLTLGTDYTVAYSNYTNVGTATVTITGIGNYSGTQTANFQITALVPSAPAAPLATAGNRQVTVTWAAPAQNGGTPVTGYIVTGSPSGSCTTTGATQCIVTGLVNGTVYTFSVVAQNAAGNSPASDPSTAVRPLSDLRPVLFSATPNTGSVDGGTTVTLLGSELAGATSVRFGEVAARSFRVVSDNQIVAESPAQPGGTGGAVSMFVDTPVGRATLTNGFVYEAKPAVPGTPIAAPGNGQATVSWAQVFDRGGSPESYTVTSQPDGRTCSVAYPGLAFTYASCVVDGLRNGVTYTFTVTATNTLGSSNSGSSNAVTPLAQINGACGAANNVETLVEPKGLLCGSGTAGTVSFAEGTFRWRCEGLNGGSSQQCSASGISSEIDQKIPSGVTLTSDNVKDTQGAKGCELQSAQLMPPPSQGPGDGWVMPYGAVSFEMVKCDTSTSAVTVRLTYADVVEGMEFWKFVVNSQGVGSWVRMDPNRLSISGKTVEYVVEDNGDWDSDPRSGAIVDPIGPAYDSNSVTPPEQPTNVRVTPGDRSATISWTPPSSGGQPSRYRVEALINGAPSGIFCEVAYPATQCTIQGLTNGQAYTIQVSAINGAGGSTPVVDPTPVTPRPTPPPPNPIPVMEEAGLITLATLMVMLGGWSQRRRHAHRGPAKIKNQGK